MGISSTTSRGGDSGLRASGQHGHSSRDHNHHDGPSDSHRDGSGSAGVMMCHENDGESVEARTSIQVDLAHSPVWANDEAMKSPDNPEGDAKDDDDVEAEGEGERRHDSHVEPVR